MPTPHPRAHHSRARFLFPALLGALLAPAIGFSNGTRLPNQNAEATARGNAFVATADNPSAIYYNPAGLTQLPGLQIQSDAYAILARYDYAPAGGGPSVEASYILVLLDRDPASPYWPTAHLVPGTGAGSGTPSSPHRSSTRPSSPRCIRRRGREARSVFVR